MLKYQGDASHPDKKSTHYSERHQQATSDWRRFISYRYNPSEEESNRNKLAKLHFTSLKISVTRVTM